LLDVPLNHCINSTVCQYFTYHYITETSISIANPQFKSQIHRNNSLYIQTMVSLESSIQHGQRIESCTAIAEVPVPPAPNSTAARQEKFPERVTARQVDQKADGGVELVDKVAQHLHGTRGSVFVDKRWAIDGCYGVDYCRWRLNLKNLFNV